LEAWRGALRRHGSPRPPRRALDGRVRGLDEGHAAPHEEAARPRARPAGSHPALRPSRGVSARAGRPGGVSPRASRAGFAALLAATSLQKPPLVYSMTAAAYRVRRVCEGTARLTPALAAVAAGAVTWTFGMAVRPPSTGA